MASLGKQSFFFSVVSEGFLRTVQAGTWAREKAAVRPLHTVWTSALTVGQAVIRWVACDFQGFPKPSGGFEVQLLHMAGDSMNQSSEAQESYPARCCVFHE